MSYLLFVVVAKLFQVNLAFVKSKKRVSKVAINKLIISSENERKIVQKISNNFPRLTSDFSLSKAKEILSGMRLNFDLPLYLIKVCNNTILSSVYAEISFLKKLENSGTYTNLVVVCNCGTDKINNIKYLLAKLDFSINPTRLYSENTLSPMQISMLNMLNINYYCGTNLGENMTKYEDYCIKSKGGEQYIKKMNSTMQSSLKQLSVLCNFSVEKSTTYNYLNDNLITRFDFSKAEGKEVVSKFLSFEKLKYFHVEVHSFYILIIDFLSGEKTYYCSNKPVFQKAIYNKKGLYFSFVSGSSFVYIIRSKNLVKFDSILGYEREFIKAQTMLNFLPKIKVSSGSVNLDEIVNKTLPQQIISKLLSSENFCRESFLAFATLSKEHLAKGQTNSSLNSLVKKYFEYLSTYYGVEFGDKGIYLSSKKEQLIDSKVFFRKNNINFCLDIKNAKLNPDTFKLKGIEYSGTNYLPYNKLSQTLNLQM